MYHPGAALLLFRLLLRGEGQHIIRFRDVDRKTTPHPRWGIFRRPRHLGVPNPFLDSISTF